MVSAEYIKYLSTITTFQPGFYCVVYYATDEPIIQVGSECHTKSYYRVLQQVPHSLSRNKKGEITKLSFPTIINEQKHKMFSIQVLNRKTKQRVFPKRVDFDYPFRIILPSGFRKYADCEGSDPTLFWLDSPNDMLNFDSLSHKESLINFQPHQKYNVEDVKFAIEVGAHYPI